MKRTESLSFLIPAYNDAATIARVVRECREVGRRITDRFEIVVVSDGSTDETVPTLKRLLQKVPELRIICHTQNFGYGPTIKELYQVGKFSWLFTVPGDDQIAPKEVEKLWLFRNKADMILGMRTPRHDPPMRLFQSWIYNQVLRWLFHLDLHDVNSVRLMRKRVVDEISLATSSAFVDAELAIRAMWHRFRVIEVPIAHKKRLRGNGGGGSWRVIGATFVDLVTFRFL